MEDKKPVSSDKWTEALYETLKLNNAYDKDYDTFYNDFYAPGIKGYTYRKDVYDDMTSHGLDLGASYEDFASKIGLHAIDPQTQQTPMGADSISKDMKPVEVTPTKKPEAKKEEKPEVSAEAVSENQHPTDTLQDFNPNVSRMRNAGTDYYLQAAEEISNNAYSKSLEELANQAAKDLKKKAYQKPKEDSYVRLNQTARYIPIRSLPKDADLDSVFEAALTFENQVCGGAKEYTFASLGGDIQERYEKWKALKGLGSSYTQETASMSPNAVYLQAINLQALGKERPAWISELRWNEALNYDKNKLNKITAELEQEDQKRRLKRSDGAYPDDVSLNGMYHANYTALMASDIYNNGTNKTIFVLFQDGRIRPLQAPDPSILRGGVEAQRELFRRQYEKMTFGEEGKEGYTDPYEKNRVVGNFLQNGEVCHIIYFPYMIEQRRWDDAQELIKIGLGGKFNEEGVLLNPDDRLQIVPVVVKNGESEEDAIAKAKVELDNEISKKLPYKETYLQQQIAQAREALKKEQERLKQFGDHDAVKGSYLPPMFNSKYYDDLLESSTEEGVKRSDEVALARGNIRKLEESIKKYTQALEALRTGDKVGAWGGFLEGISDLDNWTFGLYNLRENLVAVKAHEGKMGQEAKDRLWLARSLSQESMSAFHRHGEGRFYGPAFGAGYSFPFTIGAIATYGAGNVAARGIIRGGSRMAAKYGTNWFFDTTIRATTRLAAINAAGVIDSSFQMPRIVSDAAIEKMGLMNYTFDENQRIVVTGTQQEKSWGHSLLHAGLNTLKENVSERVGTYVLEPVAKAFGIGKISLRSFGEALPYGKTIHMIQNGAFAKAMSKVYGTFEKGGYDGFVNEVLEEYIANPMTATFDENYTFADIFDSRQNLDTALSVWASSILMLGLSSTASSVKYYRTLRSVNNAYDKAEANARRLFGNENWDKIQNTILRLEGEPLVNAIYAGVCQNKSLSDEQKKAFLNYVRAQKAQAVFNNAVSEKYSFSLTGEELNEMNAMTIHAYAEGRNMQTPQEYAQAQQAFADTREMAMSALGVTDDIDAYLDTLGETPAEQLKKGVEAAKEKGLDEKAANAALSAYLNAREQQKGAMDGITSDESIRRQHADSVIRQITFENEADSEGGSGKIILVNVKGREKPVFLIRGRYENGSITGETVVVSEGNGVIEMIPASEVEGIVEESDAMTERQRKYDKIDAENKEQQRLINLNMDTPLAGQGGILIDEEGHRRQVGIKCVFNDEQGNPASVLVVDQNNNDYLIPIDVFREQRGRGRKFEAIEPYLDETDEEYHAAEGPMNEEYNLANKEQEGVSEEDAQGAAEGVTPQPATDATEKPTKPEVKYDYHVKMKDGSGNAVSGRVTNLSADGVEIEFDAPYNGKMVDRIPLADFDNGVSEIADANGNVLWNETEAVGDTEVAPQVDATPTQVGREDAEKSAIAQAEQEHKPTALERIPRSENGEPLFEQAENPEVAWDALVEFSDGNAATAKEIADAMTEEKRKALEKARKLKLKGKTPAEMLASKQANAAELAKAESEYNHWQRMANVEQNRQNAIRAQQEAEARQRATERAEAEKAKREAREEAERREREALEGIPEWHMDTPENARKRGARRYGGQIFTRQEPVNGVVGKEVEVKFSQKDLPKGHVVVMEAEQLQPSHIQGKRNPMFFIEEAQPKNRAEDVSQTAARNIAENIRPQEITSSTTAYTGAPTINTRGEVIQGNNRSDALRYLWQNNLPKQQQAYKQYLLDQAEQLGLDSNAINAMQHPVLVNQLDVDDAEAIRLGQMTAQDTESGGVERIKPKNVAQKLGDNMRTFANRLLSSSDNDATFGQLVDRNGEDVLNWMNQIGAISNTQYQSAFDSKGKLTPEAKNDLQKVLYQAVFNGGSQQLEEMFDRLPAKAQRAILSTAFRDMDSPFAGKMLPEIQSSIIAYNALMQDEGFASAKNMEEVLRAIEIFKHQTALDDRFEQYMPADNFSNFALHLAGLYKASDMSQTTIASYFNEMYDLAQGKKAATLFEEADTTEYSLAEVIKKVLGINYKPAKNGNNNVANGGADVALRNQEGQGRQPRSNKPSASGEQNQTRTESSERGGGTENAGSTGGEKGNLPPTEGREESEENELDENGRPFIKAENGTTVFGEITDDSGLTAAPIKLSEGFQDANTGKGYGLVHIEANHGEQIRQAGFTSVKEFVSFVATHYDPDNIRVGKRRDDGSGTFLIQVTDTHDNTLFIELSKDGSYWNVNSGGIFRKGYSNKKETVAKTEPQQPTNAVSSDSSLSANVKDGITNAEPNGEPTVSLDKGTTLPADQQTSDEENTKKVADSEGKNTLKAKIEAASAEVNTDPTEAQKEAGNYKKGHVQVGTFDITIENPKGSERSGTDANGKKWSVKMNNTYGYIRGAEGVDGDHIDVFLAEDMDKWDGKYVFVVDQYNPDGTFDEHKVMLGFNSMVEARSAYLSNYEKGWENGRRIVVARIKTDDFQKWVDSSHRKTKPFAHYVIAGAADVSDNEKKPSASKKGKPHVSKENEVKRTVEHFPMETTEEAAAFDKRVPEMKDSELLAYMQEDGKGDINSAYHMSIYDEYDYRHTDEQTEAYNTYIQQLHDSNTTLEQAEEMLGNILGDVERFATDERSQLIGQSDALQDYITELERQKEDERAEAENSAENTDANHVEEADVEENKSAEPVEADKSKQYGEYQEVYDNFVSDVENRGMIPDLRAIKNKIRDTKRRLTVLRNGAATSIQSDEDLKRFETAEKKLTDLLHVYEAMRDYTEARVKKAEAAAQRKPWSEKNAQERMDEASKNPLTEEEIQNAPTDEVNKANALDYLSGNHGLIQSISYLKVYEDVRNPNGSAASDSGTKDKTQLAGRSNSASEGRDTGGKSGGTAGRVDNGGSRENVSEQSDGGKSGERSTRDNAGEGSNTGISTEEQPVGRRDANSGKPRRGGTSGRTRSDGGRSGRGESGNPATENGKRRAASESVKEESADDFLNQALGEFKDVLDDFIKAGRGELSISLVGLNSKQMEILPRLIQVGAKVGYAYIRKGVHGFTEWANHVKEAIGKYLRDANLSDDEIDAFIKEMWKSKIPFDGQIHTLEEWASIYSKKDLRNKVRTTIEEKREAQRQAESISVKTGDINNIRETLPFLLPQQQEDVLRAETQFFDETHQDREHANGKGYMFTNGTGTGKTYTGLGIVKRFVKQGKKRILILTPSQPKVRDWINDGKNLGLEIKSLDDWAKERGTTATTEAGEGTIITTYANFRQNEELLNGTFDLIVYDESHRLMENKNAANTIGTNQHHMIANRDAAFATIRLRKINPFYQERDKVNDEFKEKREQLVKELTQENPNEMDGSLVSKGLIPHSTDAFNWHEEDTERFPEFAQLHNRFQELTETIIKKVDPQIEEQAKKDAAHTKVVFLSATPFNTRENIDYAQGYIFSYPDKEQARGYSVASPQTIFFEEHFGAAYKWRYGRLEHSERNAEAIAQQEREFSDWLQHTLCTMSGRIIDSEYDYSRDFPVVSVEHAEEINNAAEEILRDKYFNMAYHKVFGNYNYAGALFETLKVATLIPRIKQHLEAGRKVVIFHRRVESKTPLIPPFAAMLSACHAIIDEMKMKNKPKEEIDAARHRLEELKEKWRGLLKWESMLDYSMPREQIAKAFGADNVLYFSGQESTKVKNQAVDSFNNDESGKNIIVIQEASGKEGISLHDTTGKHQRVLITLALPQSPITALQIEGRIYRIGNRSNAIFEYPLLGLNSEIILFGQKFNGQIGTTENLALGSQARNLRESFARSVEESGKDVPIEEQGFGGKEADAAERDETSPFDRAVLDYYGNQKLKGKRDSREGVDYYPTPEPLGFKMVEWGNLNDGETTLEPSAGHGAIARYVPSANPLTAIEPSQNLFAKLQLKAGGSGRKFVNTIFEGYNVVNKHDVIFMNPPFGTGGRLAVDHVAKAFTHLTEGGRIVAIIPRGSTDKKFDKWIDEQENAVVTGEIMLPDITFQQAGTSVMARVLVIDKVTNQSLRSEAERKYRRIDLSRRKYDKIEDFFEDIRDIQMPSRTIDEKARMLKRAAPALRDIKELKGVVDVQAQEDGIDIRTKGSAMGFYLDLTVSDFSLQQQLRTKYQRYAQEIEWNEHRHNEKAVEIYKAYNDLVCRLLGKTAEEVESDITREKMGLEQPHEEQGVAINVAPQAEESPSSEQNESTTESSPYHYELKHHTKTGAEMFMAMPNEKSGLSSEEYSSMLAKAKKHGGYWNRFMKGFAFPSEKSAKDFLAETGNTEPQADERYQKAGTPLTPNSAEVALRDAIADLMRKSGLDVLNTKEGQRVLDEAKISDDIRTHAMLSSLVKAANVIRGWLANNKRGKSFTIELPTATQHMVRRAMGRDFDSHNITANGVAHAQKNHGVGGQKLNKKSIPLTKADMELIPYIMTAPDYVRRGSDDVSGRVSVRFYKELSNGYVVVAEKEYKNSPDDMETITMWAEMSDKATNAQRKTAPDTHVQNAILDIDAAKIRKDAENAIAKDQNIREHRVYHGSGVRFFRTSNGEAYGFTVGGKIYIDPRIATAETPIHEYAHLWATAMREGNPTEWKNIVGLMKGTSVWAEVQKLYPELKNDDDIADEVLATFSGLRGAERLRAEQQKIMQGDGSVFEKAAAVGALARVKQALSKFWKGVADFLGIHYTSAEEVADRVMKDLLEGVDPRKFGVSSNDDIRLSTSEELSQRYGSRWIEEQTNEDGRHTTQVKNTINSYKKFGDFVKRDSNGKNVSILDASSGLGLGTEWMRENGMNVDDVEPYPSENRIAPTYTSYNDIHKKYDYIISNAVLNVIPDDWRANVLHDMTDKLKKGGKLVINVRSAESIRKQGKEGITRITQDDASEILVLRPNGSIKAYQKGFTKDELKKWCETELGSDYSVEIANEKNAGGSYDTAVVVTKNSESDNILYRQGEDTPHVSTSSESKTKAAQKATENLNLGGRVVVHESAEGLEGKEATAKGWYDTQTGQIHVVLSNNADAADVTQTILHEAVAHHGLRELFGHNVMDAFLDSVLAAASQEVKNAINELRRGNGWNFRTATEEYLAGLAERTDFERMTAEERGLFATLRRLFNRALEFLGLKNHELSDRELAYILWCSYQNLKTGEKGRYVAEAERIAMRYKLKAGKNAMTDTEKKEHSVLLRGKLDNLQEILAKDTYERLVTSGSHLERTAWVDMLSPLQDLQHAIEKNGGFKLGDFENPYNAYITMSSRNYAQMDIYKRTLYADMIEAIHALGSETGRSYEEIKTYVMAKHGMERQKYMAGKAAEEAYDRYKSMHPFGQKTLDDFIDEYEEKSFAGLTELFGTQSVSDAMDEAQKYVEEVESEAGSLADSLWDSIRAATKSSLQRAYEAGLISKETYDNVSSMYQYYIPLRGFDEATSDEVYEYFGDQTINGGTGSFMKKAKGRKSVADDPFAVIGNMAEMAIMQSNRNLMKQQLLNLALNHPSDLISVSDLYVKFDEDYDNGDGTRGAWVPVAVPDTNGMTTEEANQVMLDFQDDMEEKVKAEPDTYALAHQKPHIPYRVLGRNMNEHQVMVKRGGKTYILTINGNPRAAQAINGLLNPDATENPGAIALKAMTNWIARMATARNVEFAISNAMRDLEFSTTLIPKEGTEYYGRYVKNYLTCVKNIGRLVNRLNGNTLDMSNPLEKAFYDFIYNGGETGYTFMKGVERYKGEITKALSELRAKEGKSKTERLGNKIVYGHHYIINDAWNIYMKGAEYLSRCTEDWVRFAVFLTSRQSGRSMEQSIMDAKEVTVNFNRKGAGSKSAGKWDVSNFFSMNNLHFLSAYAASAFKNFYAFSNASIQGLDKNVRLHLNHTAGMLMWDGAAVTLGMLSAMCIPLMLSAIGGDPDDYWDMPESMRRMGIMLPLGKDGRFLTLPMSIEHRAAYGIGELLGTVVCGSENLPASEITFQAFEQLSQILPLDLTEGNGSMLSLVPTAVRPEVEIAFNKNWLGMPIYKEPFNKNTPAFRNVYQSTNPNYIAMSKWLNEVQGGGDYERAGVQVNPAMVQHLVESYTGGAGKFVSRTSGVIAKIIQGEQIRSNEIPFYRTLVKSVDDRTHNRAARERFQREYDKGQKLIYKIDNYQKESARGNSQYVKELDEFAKSKDFMSYMLWKSYNSVKSQFDNARSYIGDDKDKRAALDHAQMLVQKMMTECARAVEDSKTQEEADEKIGRIQSEYTPQIKETLSKVED